MTNLVSFSGGVVTFAPGELVGMLVAALGSAIAVGAVLFLITVGFDWVVRMVKGSGGEWAGWEEEKEESYEEYRERNKDYL